MGEAHEKTKESSEYLKYLTQQAVALQRTMNEIYKNGSNASIMPLKVNVPSHFVFFVLPADYVQMFSADGFFSFPPFPPLWFSSSLHPAWPPSWTSSTSSMASSLYLSGRHIKEHYCSLLLVYGLVISQHAGSQWLPQTLNCGTE